MLAIAVIATGVMEHYACQRTGTVPEKNGKE